MGDWVRGSGERALYLSEGGSGPAARAEISDRDKCCLLDVLWENDVVIIRDVRNGLPNFWDDQHVGGTTREREKSAVAWAGRDSRWYRAWEATGSWLSRNRTRLSLLVYGGM